MFSDGRAMVSVLVYNNNNAKAARTSPGTNGLKSKYTVSNKHRFRNNVPTQQGTEYRENY